jgi:hypothetical protein
VIHPERFSGWRRTLDESPLVQQLNQVERAQIFGAKPENWKRLEESLQSLGHCLCLGLQDLNDPAVLLSANSLKIKLVKQAFRTDESLDNSIEYIKWIGKSCQFILLRSPVQTFTKIPLIYGLNGEIAPFDGPLRYISDLIQSGERRKFQLSMLQAMCLAQLGNQPRATSHPSKNQIRESISQTVNAFEKPFEPSAAALEEYRQGISSIVDDYGYMAKSHAHVSLVNSGKLEASRSKGGGSLLLVAMTRKYTDRILTPELLDVLSQRFDQFGTPLVNPATAELARKFLGYQGIIGMKAYNINPTVGDILFVQPEEIENLWEQTLRINRRVPIKLAQLLTLTASNLIREVGEYEPAPEVIEGIMTFKSSETRFKPKVDILKVRAGVSIEAGLKARLTTAGMAAFSHLSQLPANYMRDYLSKDPFLKTGFLETDKFWEVLKSLREN